MSKGKSFEALKAEIAQLEVQAAEARRIEVKDAIASIRGIITKYNLTPADLGFKGQALSGARGRAATNRPGAGVPRYRDPDSGKTWTGAGKPPAWIASARNRESYLIDPAPTASATAANGTGKKNGAAASKPAPKPAAKATGKVAGKQPAKATANKATKPAKAASTVVAAPSAKKPGKKPSAPATKAASSRPRIAVRKLEVAKRPRPASRKPAVGGTTGAGSPEAAAPPAESTSTGS